MKVSGLIQDLRVVANLRFEMRLRLVSSYVNQITIKNSFHTPCKTCTSKFKPWHILNQNLDLYIHLLLELEF
jgi:hypothetical protein